MFSFTLLDSALTCSRFAPSDYGCALQKDILVQGRFYVSENHICFHANIFGWITNVSLVSTTEITKLTLAHYLERHRFL